MKQENIRDLIHESEQLLGENNVADAVRVSGEALVLADSAWCRKYNEGKERREEIIALLDAGVAHCLTLFIANEWKETLDTAVLLDFQAALDGISQREVTPQLLKLRNMALTALLNLLENMPGNEDEQLREHVQHITRYLLGLTHCSFATLTSAEPSTLDPATRMALVRSRETMQFLLDNGMTIESPDVTVGNTSVNPLHPIEIMRDLLGRMRAIGI